MNDRVLHHIDQNKHETVQGHVLIQACNLKKTFYMAGAAIPVLNNVMLDVQTGVSVAILGASGSGKSTLLHILGGLLKPTGGSVIFKNQDIYRLSSGKRTKLRSSEIGFVFQFYHLLPELDVIENIMLPAMNHNHWLASYLQGLSRHNKKAKYPQSQPASAHEDTLEARAMALLKSIGLSNRARHLPAELSGGEQQRVALARALINQPDLILADEPTGNLDSVTGMKVLDLLVGLTREKGYTLILVTHNVEIARRCDYMLKLKDGCLACY